MVAALTLGGVEAGEPDEHRELRGMAKIKDPAEKRRHLQETLQTRRIFGNIRRDACSLKVDRCFVFRILDN